MQRKEEQMTAVRKFLAYEWWHGRESFSSCSGICSVCAAVCCCKLSSPSVHLSCWRCAVQLQRMSSMNVLCSDLNCLNMILNSLRLNAFQSSHSPVSALAITFSVLVKSLLLGTIKGGLGLLNPACQNSNGPFGSSVIHLCSVNSWQPCPSIDYQL